MSHTTDRPSGLVVRPLTPTIGAEVLGVDLSDLTDAELEAIRRALTEHQVMPSPDGSVCS